METKDFNQRLFSIDTNDIQLGIDALRKDFPTFFDIYFENVVRMKRGEALNEMFYSQVKAYLTDPYVQKLSDTTNIVYGNFFQIPKRIKRSISLL